MKKVFTLIAILSLPILLFAQNNPNCSAKFKYEFKGCDYYFSSTAATSSTVKMNYSWSFGDGHGSEELNPKHIFTKDGTYEVCLKVYSGNNNCYDAYCEKVTISNCGVKDTVKDEGCKAFFETRIENCFVGFTNKSSGNFSKLSWDFGDGSTSNEKNPKHEYKANGVYPVCLTVFNDQTNCKSHYCSKVEVKDCKGRDNNHECKANFMFKPNGCEMMFSNTSKGDFTNVHWDFGDGSSSKDKSPSHKYSKDGAYKVCLTVFNEKTNCKSQTCLEVNVKGCKTSNPTSCEASFGFKQDSSTFYFNNTSKGTNASSIYNWDFGNGYFSKVENPTFVYTEKGNFKVCLKVITKSSTNAGGGDCVSSFCKEVHITDLSEYKEALGVNVNSGVNYYKVYPNPVLGNELNIRFDKRAISPNNLTLINSIGQQIHFTTTVAGNLIKLEFEKIPSGFYYLRINEPGNQSVQKIIVQ